MYITAEVSDNADARFPDRRYKLGMDLTADLRRGGE
jgi:hypothetical protein